MAQLAALLTARAFAGVGRGRHRRSRVGPLAARWIQSFGEARDAQQRLAQQTAGALRWRDKEVRALLHAFRSSYKSQDVAAADREYLGFCDPPGEWEARARGRERSGKSQN